MRIVLLFLVLLGFTSIKSQNATVIFPKNVCQIYQNQTNKIEFKIYGLSDEKTQSFITQSLKNDKVSTFTITPTLNGVRTGKIEFVSQIDFDYFKNIFVNYILFVNVEDVMLSIDSWKPFTNEQCQQLIILNRNITNVEGKMKFVLEDTYQKSLADSNGWFMKATDYLIKSKEDKREYLETIK